MARDFLSGYLSQNLGLSIDFNLFLKTYKCVPIETRWNTLLLGEIFQNQNSLSILLSIKETFADNCPFVWKVLVNAL